MCIEAQIEVISERSKIVILRGLKDLEQQVVTTVAVAFAESSMLPVFVPVKIVACPGEMLLRRKPTWIRPLKRVA